LKIDPNSTGKRTLGFTERSQPKLCACLYLSQKQYRNSVAVPVSAGTPVPRLLPQKQLITLTGNWANPTKFVQGSCDRKNGQTQAKFDGVEGRP
jgi:hypothetical protein